jgi:antitoxin component YwqK of YwqJK toxin-antitoxin module
MRVNIEDTTVDEGETVLYQGEPLTGEVVDTAPDGTVITLRSYRDGREEGPQREWYDDGTPESEYRVTDSKLTGETLDWHPNGRLARRQEFDEFGQLRMREVWDEDGQSVPNQSFDLRSGDVAR